MTQRVVKAMSMLVGLDNHDDSGKPATSTTTPFAASLTDDPPQVVIPIVPIAPVIPTTDDDHKCKFEIFATSKPATSSSAPFMSSSTSTPSLVASATTPAAAVLLLVAVATRCSMTGPHQEARVLCLQPCLRRRYRLPPPTRMLPVSIATTTNKEWWPATPTKYSTLVQGSNRCFPVTMSNSATPSDREQFSHDFDEAHSYLLTRQQGPVLRHQ